MAVVHNPITGRSYSVPSIQTDNSSSSTRGGAGSFGDKIDNSLVKFAFGVVLALVFVLLVATIGRVRSRIVVPITPTAATIDRSEAALDAYHASWWSKFCRRNNC